MTTRVIVAAPAPGHLPIRVQQQTRTADYTGGQKRFADWQDSGEPDRVEPGGCSKEYYVHDSMRLVVEEITGG